MITTPVLVDAGPLVALMSERQSEHAACKAAMAHIKPPLVTCLPVLTEAAYLLRRYPRQMRSLLAAADGVRLTIAAIESADLPAINAILAKYEDGGLQFADACLMHLAEREAIDTIFTLDRRDFGTYRRPSGEPLRLLP